jgi:ribosome-associated protein
MRGGSCPLQVVNLGEAKTAGIGIGVLSVMDESVVRITDTVSIPMSELRFRFARSSGPGGQHVNRSATQVELLFDVANSPSLDETQRRRVLRKLKSRIDKDGILHLVSQETRSQYRNREEVVERFQELMRQALRVPKRRLPTRPTRAARERRLEEKRRRSEKKRCRRPVRPDP